MDFVTTMVERFGGQPLNAKLFFEYHGVEYPITSVSEERLTYSLRGMTDDYLSLRSHTGIFHVEEIRLKGSPLIGKTIHFKIGS